MMERTHQAPLQCHSKWSENVADELKELAVIDIAIFCRVRLFLVRGLGTGDNRPGQYQGQSTDN